ncbi:hypothetical protein JX580_02300 [Thiomicrospira microaerophila]|uniref:hypothetical protein n=1 Tax=Thiomicrospira microaerophila TaxID=406020 RepID=UPI00200F9321|nr:hypothetical protein [Thiomicrospira microaerophila]UQB42749.1 hypothetical protein JX580_02300 [Thiomicrospira microaerophila]
MTPKTHKIGHQNQHETRPQKLKKQPCFSPIQSGLTVTRFGGVAGAVTPADQIRPDTLGR